MLGTNEIAKARSVQDGLLVHSMFYTIQGEGPWMGCPAVFLRFAGCNLACSFCDTEFEVGAKKFAQSSTLFTYVTSYMRDYKCNRLVITGGEPMLQPLTQLILQLVKSKIKVQIETAGTVWPENFDYVSAGVVLVCSPKTIRLNRNIEAIDHLIHFKYVIQEGKLEVDGLPIGVYRRKTGSKIATDIFVSPCEEIGNKALTEANMQAAVTSALQHGYRLSLQMHKIVGVP